MAGKINARKKGHAYELWVINKMKSIGLWPKAVSSRDESRSRDNAKVDICYTDPFNIQCKAVENLGSAHKILDSMPQDEPHYNVVFHKKNRKGTVVSMNLDDFLEILMMLKNEDLI